MCLGLTLGLNWRPPPKYLEGPSTNIRRNPPFVKENLMPATETPTELLIARPKRADARRNYEKLLSAAREAFAEGGEATSLEEIARRAGVGIGTLYRHFPNRQALLEALYVEEVGEVCRSAADLGDKDPLDALNTWFERFIA